MCQSDEIVCHCPLSYIELFLTSSSNLHLIVYGDYGNKNSLKTWVKIQETEQIRSVNIEYISQC